MPVPQALVTRYFQLVSSRQFTEAERELERIKEKMQKSEWNRGYFRALYGMFLSQKNKDADGYSFFTKLDLSDKAALHAFRREFLDHTRNGLHGDFDRGYFSAWADCMRVLARLEVPAQVEVTVPAAKIETTEEVGELEEKTTGARHLETLRSDKSQATIANFLKKKLDDAESEE